MAPFASVSLTFLLTPTLALAFVALPATRRESIYRCPSLARHVRQAHLKMKSPAPSGIQAAVQDRMKTAMKERKKDELSAIRLMVAAMTTKQKVPSDRLAASESTDGLCNCRKRVWRRLMTQQHKPF